MSVDASQMHLLGLGGRVALVTGGARGIGRRIAETLAALGARTAAGDLVAPELEDVLGIELDVTSERSVDDAFRTIEKAFGAPDIVVLNAGIFVMESTQEMTFESWRTAMSVNLDCPFLCVRRALPAMQRKGYGRIVVSAWLSGTFADPVRTAAYSASKAGVMSLMESIAREYSGVGITANAVSPAIIRTPMAGDSIETLADRTLFAASVRLTTWRCP